jgi:WD40 repeat protein
MTDTAPALTTPAQRGKRSGYDAFLSYSHHDREVATGVQRGLHQIGRRVGQLRALRIFRDDTNLEASPDLWAGITEALDQARYLVMVLSPAAAGSYWVNREISYWLEHKGPTGVLLIVATGAVQWDSGEQRFDPQLSDAVPPALIAPGTLAAEPLYIDVSADAPWDPRAAAFRGKVTAIAAAIHGKPKDELASDDLTEQRKFRRLRAAAIAGLILITIAAVVAARMAVVARNEARDELLEVTKTRLVAESEAMLGDTRPGTDDQAFLQLLAAHTIKPTPVDGALSPADGALYTAVATKVDTEKIIKLSNPVYSIAVNAGRSLMASGSGDHKVRLWDLRTKRISHVLEGHTESVWGLAFSPDGSLLASGSDDHSVRLWDTAKGVQVGQFKGHTDAVRRVAFNHDGKRLATASFDHSVGIWEVATQRVVTMLTDHTSDVYGVAFSPDGKLLASASDDQTVRLWDADSLTQIGQPLQHGMRVRAVAFSPDSKRLASASRDGLVQVWDLTNGRARKLPGHQGSVYDVAFRDDQQLVSSSRDGTVRVWDVEQGTLIGDPITGHDGIVNSIAFFGRHLISCSNDGTIRFWNLDATRLPIGHTKTVRSVAVSPDGRLIATGADDKSVRLWDPGSPQPGRELGHHDGPVRAVAFSPDGSRLVSASEDGTVREWDVASGRPVGPTTMRHENGKVYSVAFSPDGRRIVSGSDDHTVRRWDAETGAKLAETTREAQHRVYAVAFSPDGRRIVTGGDDDKVRLWDAVNLAGASLKEIGKPLPGHQDPVWTVAFSPNGQVIASGSADNSVRLWDAQTGNQIGDPLPERDVVWGVAFSRDSKQLASASGDNTVRLWDAKTRDPIGDPLKGHSGAVNSVVFSSDGRRVYSASDDNTVRVWPTTASPEDLCNKLTVNISHAQWDTWVSPRVPYAKVCPNLPES